MDFKIPKIGLRNIKTAISVLLCLLVFENNAFYAAIASVICTQSSVEGSITSGINRLSGTLLGGLIGIVLLFISKKFNIPFLNSLFTSIGIVAVIYACNLIKKPGACSISCIVLIAIMTAPTRNPYYYAIMRTIETSFGILIAIVVNKYVNPSKFKKFFKQ